MFTGAIQSIFVKCMGEVDRINLYGEITIGDLNLSWGKVKEFAN